VRPVHLLTACASALIVAVAIVGVTFAVPPAAHSDTATPMPTAAAKGASRVAPLGPAVPRIGIRTFVAPRGIRIDADLTYATTAEGAPLKLDVCRPPTATDGLLPAVFSVHGGSWTHGDKANSDWRNVCAWLASEGFVAFSVDYSLAPARFPTAITELREAVRWLREPANASRYGIDPARIGVFGGSAGGSLAALLGVGGSGSLTTGARVAAVAELSGPVDLTAHGQLLGAPSRTLQSIELKYLGCLSFTVCPQAAEASAVRQVDPSDPPVFIGAARDEFVPAEQGEAFAAALEKAGVEHTVRVVPGDHHSIGTLDAGMRQAVAAFLHAKLG
jgi:acetyl esterase/lipase